MKKVKLLGLVLVALCASSAALSASAMALELPENLPALKTGETRTYTGKNVGSTEFRTENLAVVCTGATGEGTETASKPPEGAFHIHFTGCTAEVSGAKVKCTGLGDETGTILALGTASLVFDREKGKTFAELTTALLFKNLVLHFSCSIVLVQVEPGETLCLHVKPTTKSLTHEFKCLGPEKGVAPVEEYSTTDTGTFKEPKLTSRISEAEKTVPSLQIGNGTNTGTVEVFADQ